MTGGEIIGTPAAAPAANDSTSRETVPADGALLVVDVPADADIYVNGSKTSSQGNRRRFLSRGLTAGKQYEFVVRMAVDRNGKVEESTKVVSLTAGERSDVTFTDAAAAAVKTSLTLHVPADAKVWLAGSETASAGAERHFETANLAPGQSWRNYEIRVATTVDGRERTVSKVITLAAGDSVELTLDPAARTAQAEETAAVR